ncbi:hypothetical protein AAHA92_23132 [Salvia divinorum]|uniref:Uncharacterized protein n=1 Tax=Salvia divinorum TaxID=28513 RepID=A0ABD1GUQ8_SALDI
MAVVMTASSLSTVRSEATTAGNGAPVPENRKLASARPLLSVSKPTWIVRTEARQIRSNWPKWYEKQNLGL